MNTVQNHASTIRAGDRVWILPQWRDAGDDKYTFVARDDEIGGRVNISALELRDSWGPLWPMQRTDVSMLSRVAIP